MWGNFLSQSEAAKERLAAALERTGDILTEKATAHVAKQATTTKAAKKDDDATSTTTTTTNDDVNDDKSPPSSSDSPLASNTGDSTTTPPPSTSTSTNPTTTTDSKQPQQQQEQEIPDPLPHHVFLTPTQQQQLLGKFQSGWGNVVQATKHISDVTKKAVDETTHHIQQQQQQQQQKSNVAPADSSGGESSEKSATEQNQQNPNEMLNRLNVGWGSVLEATKTVVEATKNAVEHESHRFLKTPKRRDPQLPLDVDALKDAEVVYVTNRLIAMGHPAMQSSTDGDITPERKLAAVGHLLQKRHGGKFMVWNLSEVEYDYGILDDQVLSFQFPGSPSPPLGLMLKLLLSIESWLKASPQNVAIIHCLTGKGRTSTVLAAFLCWMGEAGFHDVNQALEYIAACKRVDVESLTIPSQRRYAMYFANMLDGVRPHQPPLLLKRIIMSEAPKFGKNPIEDNLSDNIIAPTPYGCSPYLQIFKAGQLILTTTAQSPTGATVSSDAIPFVADSPVVFTLDTVLQGDILVRCRHLTRKGQRVSMFRAAFHTGYTPAKVLRLSKAQLDGACNDDRFPEVFFLDLIFEACDASMASKHLLSQSNPKGEEKSKSSGGADAAAGKSEPEIRRNKATLRNYDGGEVSAFEYDTMLHRDSRFWDVIATRRQECLKKVQQGQELVGATVGKRRDFDANKTDGRGEGEASTGEEGSKDSKKTKPGKKRTTYESFSITGGDLQMTEDEVKEEEEHKLEPKRDELMDALMAIDDDDLGASSASLEKGAKKEDREKEIVFDDEEEEKKKNLFKQQQQQQGDGATKEGDKHDSTDTKTTEASTENKAETSTTEPGSADDKPQPTPTTTETTQKDGNNTPPKNDEPVTTTNKENDNEKDEFDDADLDMDDDDAAAAAAVTTGDDDYDFDDDDAELDDLENFLTKAKNG